MNRNKSYNVVKKYFDVSTLVTKCNKTKVLEEIQKCDVLCSNCHRDLHFREKNADFA